MKTINKVRRAMLSAAVVLGAVAGASALPVTAASAATTTIHPFSAQGCSGDTCIYLAGNSGGTALVQGWAYTSNFYGHFYLSGPGIGRTSPTQTWYGHKGNYWSQTVTNARAGKYCMSGYSNSGGFEGTACETLH